MGRLAWMVALVVSVSAGGWLIWRAGPAAPVAAAAAGPAPAVPVSVATVLRRDVPVPLLGLGTVQAFNSVTVRSQADGQLLKIAFTEGQAVRAGDLLAQIDPRPYQAALDQALAKKAQDEALLANARAELERSSTLAQRQFATRQQLDTTKAQVAQLEAANKGDEAAIANARVLLGYTTIRAPIDGRAGLRLVDQGNLVRAAEATGIVMISQMTPLSVVFTLPEDVVPRLLKAMAAGPLSVTVLGRDGRQVLDSGQLDLIDNQIDATTGTIRIKATLPNRDGLLWPGQFVNVRLLVDTRSGALTIPVSSVLRGQQGAYVYVLKDGGTVEPRPVVTGPAGDEGMVIESGLAEGETVISAGQYRLQPGARVLIRSDSPAEPRS